jgi:hypothetical protein
LLSCWLVCMRQCCIGSRAMSGSSGTQFGCRWVGFVFPVNVFVRQQSVGISHNSS